ncbi:hypothetical protein J5J83_08135 [Azoarcus sp. L1K30]|nr:hypothetical protein [Azoarcus sp. L1K30]
MICVPVPTQTGERHRSQSPMAAPYCSAI